MEKVLVAGATGATGNRVVKLLKQSQYFKPVAMVRKKNQVSQFENENIDTVLGDLEKDISHTVKGIDKVVFAAGSKGKNLIEVDKKGAKKLIDASQNQRIKKFVMLSSMGADQPKNHNELKDYLEAKKAADDYAKASDLNYVIVRPGELTNDKGTGYVKIEHHLNEKGSISRDDVAQTIVRMLHDDAASRETFEILEGNELIGKSIERLK